jgi:hypothetical protein
MQHATKVIPFPEQQRKKAPKPRRFGTVISRNGRLSIRFTYFGEVVQRTTGLADSRSNRAKARRFLGEIERAMEAGTFRYEEAFPGASPEEKEKFSPCLSAC